MSSLHTKYLYVKEFGRESSNAQFTTMTNEQIFNTSCNTAQMTKKLHKKGYGNHKLIKTAIHAKYL